VSDRAKTVIATICLILLWIGLFLFREAYGL
jgi:hypothetical protein